jgi:cyanophycinase-like exopeptidase
MSEVECECGRRYETRLVDSSYDIDGYTKREEYPEEEECGFCQGEEFCSVVGCSRQATVYDKDGDEVYCVKHWAESCKENDQTVEESEELVVRLDERLHVKPKGR